MASARLDGATLPVITKHITQEVINQFEGLRHPQPGQYP